MENKEVNPSFCKPKEPDTLEKAVRDIYTQAGYEIEQARHHMELAEKLGLEKRFSFIGSVSGFERLRNQLSDALNALDAGGTV